MALNNIFDIKVSQHTLAEALQEDGYAVIKNVLSYSDVCELQAQAWKILHAGVKPDAENEFMGAKTLRKQGLLACLPKSREMVVNPYVISACDSVLKPFCPTYQLHFTSIMHVTEGEKAQVLHRDISPFANPSVSTVLATMWAGTDFTRENGATVIAPGSHKWYDSGAPRPQDLEVAEMHEGSVLLYVGNLLHGAGACKKGYRMGISIQYTFGWLRQEENQYLSVPLELARTFPENVQKIMGYDLAARHWGYVDQTHPLNYLKGIQKIGDLDPPGYEFPGRVKALYTHQEDGPLEYHLDHRYYTTLADE